MIYFDYFESTLYYVLTHSFTLNPKYFNCTNREGFQPEAEPRIYIGAYFLISGVVLSALYIPCAIAIGSTHLIKSSCFKIMLLLAIFDIISLFVNSIATGILGITGTTFCEYPRTIYILGSLGNGSWMGSCITCVVLAINRFCALSPYTQFRSSFQGTRTCIAITVCILYGIAFTIFLAPIIFNPADMCWLFDPHVGLSPDLYNNLAHTINNCAVPLLTPPIYIYLCYVLNKKACDMSSDSVSKAQKQTFLQSIVICALNALVALLYVYIQFFYSPPLLMLIGQIAWGLSGGAVCLVYLTMNRTVRSHVYSLLFMSKRTGSLTTFDSTIG